MTLDPKDHKLYVVNEGDGNVSAIDVEKCPKNCKLLQNIVTGKSPTSIALDNRTGNLYVSGGKTNNVFIIYPPIHPPHMELAFDNGY